MLASAKKHTLSVITLFVLMAGAACGGSTSTESTILIESPGPEQTFRAGDRLTLGVSLSGFVFNVPPDRVQLEQQGFVGQLQRIAKQQVDESRLAHDGSEHAEAGAEEGHAEEGHIEEEHSEEHSDVEHSDEDSTEESQTEETHAEQMHLEATDVDSDHHDSSMMTSAHSHSGNETNPLARNGHMHVYLDGASGADAHITTWSYITEVKLPEDLAPGMHSLRLELRDDTHTIVNPDLDEYLYFEIVP